MVIIIDASVFVAYANRDDIHNKKATKIINSCLSGKYGRVLTTDYIFDEAVSVTLRKSNKKNAKEFGNYVLNSEIYVARIDSLVFQEAWDLFEKLERLSFTDCTIVAFMKTFNIKSLATFDKEFKNIEGIDVVDN